MSRMNNLMFKNCNILFKNFGGKPTKFTPAGQRSFCIALDAETAEDLIDQGWNVKELPPRDGYSEPLRYLKVKVNYGKVKDPVIRIKVGKTVMDLGPDEVYELDSAQLTDIIIKVRPYQWELGGKSGVAAYLDKFGATQVLDEFDSYYAKYEEDEESEELPW